ncbi:hypothetical protein H0E86_03900 [Streptomyces sp. SCSIO-PteL053]|nr:hypothetical protein H0E86_03900 [Streptomyces sp. SCSIO-PteL053]
MSRTKWLDFRQVHERTFHTAPRTVRAVLAKLARRGVVDYVEVYPGRRYRLHADAETDHAAYFAAIDLAAEALRGE